MLREVIARGSFSAAAEALNFTQSAISQHVAALERETGWRYETAFSGAEMEPFNESLLDRVRGVPSRYRKV